jgi:hypothetical protein
MKKFLLSVVCLFLYNAVSAQVTFRPGVRAGVNFSHFTKGDVYYDYYYDNNGNYIEIRNEDQFSSKTDFYVGIFGTLQLSKFYALQPEVDYSRQGSKYTYYDENLMREFKRDLDVSYLSIAIVNKFTFNNFNFHVGPTIDFVVEESFSTYNEVDFTFLIGAGYNFNKNFGIEGRIKKGIVPVLDLNDSHTNVVFSLGATYTFDVK